MTSPVAVAIAGCRLSSTSPPDDLYPDPDAGPLAAGLGALGATATLVSWDDPAADWAGFDHVVVSSTWDSVDRPAAYLDWAARAATLTRLHNPAAVIAWGLDKRHQLEMAAAGLPVVPTTWVAPDRDWDEVTPGGPEAEIVVKPAVSAGSRDTARYAPGDRVRAVAHVHRLQGAGQTVMVQEYLRAIDEGGETDLVFIGGVYSHAVLKKPVLRLGEGVVERPWERMAWSGLAAPDEAQLTVARRTLTFLGGRFGRPPTYARVDLVAADGGDPLILEVELVDPYLSFDMEPAGADRLAAAVLAGVAGAR